MIKKWWLHWKDPAIHRRSLYTSGFVGSILLIINQGSKLLQYPYSLGLSLRIGLTFLVPYLVASCTAVQTQLRLDSGQEAVESGTYRCEACLEEGTVHEIALTRNEKVPDCDQNNRETEFVFYEQKSS